MPSTLHTIARQLGYEAGALTFSSPSHVYNPLDYAWSGHSAYLDRVGETGGRVLMLGMNPGPWGMAQTGVPFGDIGMVRDWFGINTTLAARLPEQHVKYPIMGMACHRREGSGSRLWGWARERMGSPARFLGRFVVWNYCPLLFLGNHRNMIPEKLHKGERDPLVATCDKAVAAVIDVLQPTAIVGIGRYAQRRAQAIVNDTLPVAYLAHPSPASPAANKNWPALAEQALGQWLNESHQ